jgi:hypothetical protein
MCPRFAVTNLDVISQLLMTSLGRFAKRIVLLAGSLAVCGPIRRRVVARGARVISIRGAPGTHVPGYRYVAL